MASGKRLGRNITCSQQGVCGLRNGIYHIVWSLSLGKEQLHRWTPGCLHQLEACRCWGNHHNPGTETGQGNQWSCWEALLLLGTETGQLRPCSTCLAIKEPLTPCSGETQTKRHLLKAGGLCAQELAFFISLYSCSSNQICYLSKMITFSYRLLYLKWAPQFQCLLPAC